MKVFFMIPLLYILLTIYINAFNSVRDLSIPVIGAKWRNWSKESYWYINSNSHAPHLGIDIFGEYKTPVAAPIDGLVISKGYSSQGGNYIYILDCKMRIFYFAHLNSISIRNFQFVKKAQIIGALGNTGNAISRPYHLHYSDFSTAPIFKFLDTRSEFGWKKMFYINPENYTLFDKTTSDKEK